MSDQRGTTSQITSILTFRWFFVLLVVFLAAVLGVNYLVAESSGYSILDSISITQALGSVTLSAVLAYLYLRMSDIQDNQEEIMRQQHELMEADHRPLLEIGTISTTIQNHDWLVDRVNNSELNLSVSEPTEISYEEIKIPLENLGRGVAVGLKSDAEITSLDDDSDVRYVSMNRALDPANSRYDGYISVARKRRPIPGHWNNHLAPGGDEFLAKLWFRMETSDDNSVDLPFSGVLELLKNEDVESARFRFQIEYGDIVGNDYKLHVFNVDFEVDEVNTLREMLENGEIIPPDIPLRENPHSG